MSLSHRGFAISVAAVFYRRGRVYLFDEPPVVRKSANSVELLILVTYHGSGPTLSDGCSWMIRPIGVGPKAIEWPLLATVM